MSTSKDVMPTNGEPNTSVFMSFSSGCLGRSTSIDHHDTHKPNGSASSPKVNGGPVYIRSRVRDKPFGIDRSQVFNFFKWTLILFNGLLILVILGGLFVYFTDFRDKASSSVVTTDSSDDLDSDSRPMEDTKSPALSSGPKYSWIMSMFTFALLLVIPCLGFIGAIKQHVCLLVIYGTVFTVQTIVILIFHSFWFICPALLSLAAMGLVFMIRSEESNSAPNSSQKNLSHMPCCNGAV